MFTPFAHRLELKLIPATEPTPFSNLWRGCRVLCIHTEGRNRAPRDGSGMSDLHVSVSTVSSDGVIVLFARNLIEHLHRIKPYLDVGQFEGFVHPRNCNSLNVDCPPMSCQGEFFTSTVNSLDGAAYPIRSELTCSIRHNHSSCSPSVAT